ncbi:o-succinylbenzoate synthase [Erwinia sp. ErVv1]|uniref:o-succinylbenzoate synthase n=1 Tax=Erwinia sp. ErVv1 TaxID=1603299 RepID=UPI00082E289C|nr:o-succinylbenzoate synthase [Erwinia sp. ErVv1]
MRRAALFHYAIPLEAGTVLRDRRIKTRSGLLVRLEEDDREGWGEIAPLVGFSAESLDEARQDAIAWLSRWCRGESDSESRLSRWCRGELDSESRLPSVAFGLSCAQAELSGELPGEGNYDSALLCNGDPDELIDRLRQQRATVAKMKVGLYEPVRDGVMVNLLLEAVPGLTLRLDANRSWSPDKAARFAHFVASEYRSRIAFIEEPCRTAAESRRFALETGIALGWDESAREPGFTLKAEPHLRAVIIKPTLTGSLHAVRQRVELAQRAGLVAVIGSSLESSLGLTQLARIARWLTPDALPGLDTLALMQQQLIRCWPGSALPVVSQGELESIWQS